MRYHHAALYVCLLAAAVPVQAQKQDDPPPEPTVAPFDAKRAEEHQKAWAKHLGVRVKARNSIGMELMLIPPGEFLMGSPAFEDGRGDDETQHKVTLTKPFFMGITEVTQLHPVPCGVPILETTDEVTAEINRACAYLEKLR